MIIHYIWLGGDIPYRYQDNIKTCIQLNRCYQIMVWMDWDIDRLMQDEEDDIQELYYNPKNLINKYNTAKYTILKKYGGVYTDLDIEWKLPFRRIEQENGFPSQVDIVLTHSAYPELLIDDELKKVLDDPFIIVKQGLFEDCLSYRKERTQERTDATNPADKLTPHVIEPIGPFLLTEWIYKKQIKAGIINQKGYLDWKGHYGRHEQLGNWNK